MRRALIIGNWKMHKTVAQAVEFARTLSAGFPAMPDRDVAIAPPFTALHALSAVLKDTAIALCAQDVHWEQEGAFTGEVSAPMLVQAGVDAVILGHSERRQLFGETDEALARKLPAAIAAGLEPILCVGETEEARDAEQTEAVLESQIQADLQGVEAAQMDRIVVAYEPIWAIGTGRTATPQQAQEAIAFIRDTLRARGGDADRVRILYGGSVKPGNAAELIGQADIDGALVGGASLEAGDFAGIVEAVG